MKYPIGAIIEFDTVISYSHIPIVLQGKIMEANEYPMGVYYKVKADGIPKEIGVRELFIKRVIN